MAPDIDGIEFILKFFKDKNDGYLIDVGAADGLKDGSMTRDLISRGWKGILVEPLPMYYEQLKENYKDYEGVHTVPILCSDESGFGILYPHKGCSTINPEWRDACQKYWKHVNYKEPIEIPKITLKNLMKIYNTPPQIDFLQIDTEGHDLNVLKGMDWSKNPSLVCVEVLDMCNMERRINGGRWEPSPELKQYMNETGYVCVKLTKGGNAIFIRKSDD